MYLNSQGKKIGIMGGTFDPIHIGHLILAESAKEQHQLDEIWVMPNGNPQYKSDRQVTDVKHRVEMVRLSIENNSNMVLSTIEALRQGYTYTYETLEQLNASQPDDTFYFIIGADSLFTFDKWRYPEKIAKKCILLIANRSQTPMESLTSQMQYLTKAYDADIRLIDLPTIDISSEMLRNKVKNGYSIQYYVTDKVAEYVKQHRLYTT